MIKWLVCSKFGHAGQSIHLSHLKCPQIFGGENTLQLFCIEDFTWYTFIENIDFIRL